MSKSCFISVAIGAVSSALLVSDAFTSGSRKGLAKTAAFEGKHIADVYMGHQSGEGSAIIEKVKSKYREYLFDDKTISQFVAVKNVTGSCITELTKYALPIALSICAIAGGIKGSIFGRISAALLLIGGAKVLFNDVFGIGKHG